MDYVVIGRANEMDQEDNFIGFHFEQFEVQAETADSAIEIAEGQMCQRLESTHANSQRQFHGFELTGLKASDYEALKEQIESGDFDLFS